MLLSALHYTALLISSTHPPALAFVCFFDDARITLISLRRIKGLESNLSIVPSIEERKGGKEVQEEREGGCLQLSLTVVIRLEVNSSTLTLLHLQPQR